jgi:L,D-transpeptidase ErfK/SrfK
MLDEGVVLTFPISIGKMDWQTPLGRASITRKQTNPAWYPPKSVLKEYADEGRPLERVVPPGPDNPLGDYAMRLSIPGYLIHGTNRPAGVGMRVTHGCIRMFPEDIDWLFPKVSVNTPVTIVNQPYKFGWQGDELLLEAHVPLEEDERHVGREMTAIIESYVSVTGERPAAMDWRKVERVQQAGLGLPVVVGRRQVAPDVEAPDAVVADAVF